MVVASPAHGARTDPRTGHRRPDPGAADWQWLFWVNVPFGVAGFVLAWRFMPADGPVGTARLDVVGLALLSPAVVGCCSA